MSIKNPSINIAAEVGDGQLNRAITELRRRFPGHRVSLYRELWVVPFVLGHEDQVDASWAPNIGYRWVYEGLDSDLVEGDPFSLGDETKADQSEVSLYMGDSARHWTGHLQIEYNGKEHHLIGIFWPGDEGISYFYMLCSPDDKSAKEFVKYVLDRRRELQTTLLKDYIFTDDDEGEQRPVASWKDLCLPEGLQETIQSNVEGFFAAEKTFKKYRLAYRRGMLFVGPPGMGKSSILKVLASTYRDKAFFMLGFSGNEFYPRSIKSIMKRAAEFSPSIVLLEDIDRLVHSGNMRALLNELDGVSSKKGVMVIATSNQAEKLDEALIERPSRFDLVIRVDLPQADQRRRYLQMQLAELKDLPKKELENLVTQTEGYTMAMLQEIRTGALLEAVRHRRSLQTADIWVSLKRLKESVRAGRKASGKQNNSAGFKPL